MIQWMYVALLMASMTSILKELSMDGEIISAILVYFVLVVALLIPLWAEEKRKK